MSKKYSTFEQRVAWLLENRRLWKWRRRYNDPNRRILVAEMKTAGLIAPSTYWFDVRLTKEVYTARLAVSRER